MDQPLNPFPTATSIPFVSAAHIVPVLFAVVFIIWAIYTIVAFYHWLRYGDSLTVSLGAMSMHLVVSALLAIFAVSGIH